MKGILFLIVLKRFFFFFKFVVFLVKIRKNSYKQNNKILNYKKLKKQETKCKKYVI